MKKPKVLTLVGTRPELIRLSRIIPKLDLYTDHVFVHSGQNYDKNLKEVFFTELEIRNPDIVIESKSDSFGEQIGIILKEIEKIFKKIKPDFFLILGDVNTCLACIIAERMGIPTIHLEAGNRCYDLKVPEEVNRRIIDHTSSWNLPYTIKSKHNLLHEGIENKTIFVSGNPIKEVILHYKVKWEKSSILNQLGLEKKKYLLVTTHRAENVDKKKRLKNIFDSFEILAKKYDLPIIISVHPRTRSKLQEFDIQITHEQIKLCEPFGLFDFLKLEKEALLVITDSGTVQEECCLFRVPTVTIRDTTERPETVECGSNCLAGTDPHRVVNSVTLMLDTDNNWFIPEGYDVSNVSSRVLNFILSLEY